MNCPTRLLTVEAQLLSTLDHSIKLKKGGDFYFYFAGASKDNTEGNMHLSIEEYLRADVVR